MEEEVREILRAAVLQATNGGEENLGTRLAARFRKHGLAEADGAIEELRGHTARPAKLES